MSAGSEEQHASSTTTDQPSAMTRVSRRKRLTKRVRHESAAIVKTCPSKEKSDSDEDDDLWSELDKNIESIPATNDRNSTLPMSNNSRGKCCSSILNACGSTNKVDYSLDAYLSNLLEEEQQHENDEAIAIQLQQEEIKRSSSVLSSSGMESSKKACSPPQDGSEVISSISEDLLIYTLSMIGHVKTIALFVVNKRFLHCKIQADRGRFVENLASATRLTTYHARQLEIETFKICGSICQDYWNRNRRLRFNLRDRVKHNKQKYVTASSSSASSSSLVTTADNEMLMSRYSQWTCSRCTLNNIPELLYCESCNTPRQNEGATHVSHTNLKADQIPYIYKSDLSSESSNIKSELFSDKVPTASGSSHHTSSVSGKVAGYNELCSRILSGEVSPKSVAHMSVEELASPEVAAQRKKWDRQGVEDRSQGLGRCCKMYTCKTCGMKETKLWRVYKRVDGDSFKGFAECIHCSSRWEV